MSYVKIWLHCVWSTKNRTCIIPKSFRPALLKHFREDANEKNIALDYINAHEDHVHALINLGKQQNLSTVMQYLKGESSFWINSQKILSCQFSWQDDYFAVSVSHSHVDRVRQYIKNQDEHHKKISWEEEVELFLKKYGFERIKG
ncbi:MAG: IS200/IS605 family transposase [Bacteroidota bacterium]|nr:IS200/IS605 family transposase [Bacteroidota bacterium]